MNIEKDINEFIDMISHMALTRCPNFMNYVTTIVNLQQSPPGHIFSMTLDFKISHTEMMRFIPVNDDKPRLINKFELIKGK